MTPPKDISGFGKLGNFCRKILSYAKSIDLQSIIIEKMAEGVTTPPSAEITNTPSGKLVKLKIGSGGAAASNHPFHLEDASNPTDGTQVRVYYGTVNDTVPSGMSDGDDPPYILGVSGSGLVWLIVTTDSDGNVTSVSIDSGSTVPSDDDTHFYLEIGSFEVVGSAVTVADNLTGSQSFNRCRDWFSNPVSYSANWSVV
jgi:hypothetical protein